MDEIKKELIPAEIYKAAGPNALEAFHDVLLSILEEEKMPDDFRDAPIASLYKNKGSKSDCGNYRGILNRLITSRSRTSQRHSVALGPEEAL